MTKRHHLGKPPLRVLRRTMRETATFSGSVKAGFLAALASGPGSAADWAQGMHATESGTMQLVEMLSQAGLIEPTGEQYALIPESLGLGADGRQDLTSALLWAGTWQALETWDADVRESRPVPDWRRVMDGNPGVGLTLAQYRQMKARAALPALVQTLKLPNRALRLLDIGGGHGLYSIGFLQAYPALRAQVFDLPAALAETRSLAKSARVGHRLEIHAGDYLLNDMGRDFDVIFCFDLVQHHRPDDNAGIFRRVAGALVPGGQVFVGDMLWDILADAYQAAFCQVRANPIGGRPHSDEDIIKWLRSAGLEVAGHVDLPSIRSTVISARKPA
ncbi:MAG: class I SAM-dependent methyltransferase [Thermaerobacter sp.]|nr:class I SAM-dependent methyltransferase [Thermaerobacter sp.]